MDWNEFSIFCFIVTIVLIGIIKFFKWLVTKKIKNKILSLIVNCVIYPVVLTTFIAISIYVGNLLTLP
jgi:hypothetical protein